MFCLADSSYSLWGRRNEWLVNTCMGFLPQIWTENLGWEPVWKCDHTLGFLVLDLLVEVLQRPLQLDFEVFNPLLLLRALLCPVVTSWVCSTYAFINLHLYLMVSPKVDDNSVNFHFILFVNVDGHLYELGKVIRTLLLDWAYLTLYSTVGSSD